MIETPEEFAHRVSWLMPEWDGCPYYEAAILAPLIAERDEQIRESCFHDNEKTDN